MQINRKIINKPINNERVLLHACCAGCSGEIIEALSYSDIKFAIYFYNPNINTKEEYKKRLKDVERFANKKNIEFIPGPYDPEKWQQEIEGLEQEPERGARCQACFRMRFKKAAEFAKNNNFNLLTSSLGISRWKNLADINTKGQEAVSNIIGLDYWDYNWRSQGGSERMYKIAKREKFYMQKYCGCSYSLL
jgi:epoxyqueuosine reductase